MRRKISTFIIILIAVVGLFSFAPKAEAATCTGENIPDECSGACTETGKPWRPSSQKNCIAPKVWTWYQPTTAGAALAAGTTSAAAAATATAAQQAANSPSGDKTAAEQALNEDCELLTGNFNSCFVKLIYFLFYSIPSFFLVVTAKFLNVILPLALSSKMYGASSFLPNAWAVVRDLSNIFFILVLLYIAIKMILGLGGHDTKKMIISVVIMAMLINFSMFFTNIIIDSSNILALIFYNKMDVKHQTLDKNGKQVDTQYLSTLRPDQVGTQERDITGALAQNFDPTKLMSADFWTKARTQTQVVSIPALGTSVGLGAAAGTALIPIPVVGTGIGALVGTVGYFAHYFAAEKEIPFPLKIGIIITSGLVMLFASYAFFIAGISFIARLIELWMLVIFSPFAFMSFTVPLLSGIETIGWNDWLKRVLKASFMAPVFMLLMYLIFQLSSVGLFTDLLQRDFANQSTIEALIMIILPAMLILGLLMKATDFAKKASGEIGEKVFAAGKTIGGLAIGGTALGLAAAGRGTVGAFMKSASTGDTAAQRFEKGETRGRVDKFIGQTLHGTGLDKFQRWAGTKINSNQEKVEHATHARRSLDEESKNQFHKEYKDLSGKEREKVKERISQNSAGEERFGKKYNALDKEEKKKVDLDVALLGSEAQGKKYAEEAQKKQSIGSSLLQGARTGSYDARGLADLTPGEQDGGFNKLFTGLTGAIAKGMRGALKGGGINYGTPQKAFLKDLGNTISEALKSAKINVDLSHVGEEKKEGDHGGGGHH